MKRSAPSRVLALFWALVFLLNTAGDGFGAHACLYHDAAAGAHGAHHAPPAAAEHDHPAPDGEGDAHAAPFACLFACQAGVEPDLAPEPPLVLRADLHDAAPALPSGGVPLRPRFQPYFLPYANAPPALG